VRVAKLHQAASTAAATDPLTGLPNQRSFFERLDVEVLRHDGQPLSVATLGAKGSLAMVVAGEQRILTPGDSFRVPAGTAQGDTGRDVFAPPRTDLPKTRSDGTVKRA
jgi:hypothetical protein